MPLPANAAKPVRLPKGLGFWDKLSPAALATFLMAVFFLFASFGFITAGTALPWTQALAQAVVDGAIATVCAFLGTRGLYWWLAGFVVAIFVGMGLLQPLLPSGSVPLAPLGFAAIATIVSIVAGYVLFLLFISTQGRRHFRLQTEVELAGEIHRAMAPVIARRIGRFEFAGASHASGQVGGDLLEVVEAGDGWLAYISDVSGHGVGAGVLMSVVKSAVHTWRAAAGEGALAGRERFENGLLPALNRVLVELMPPEKYVTMAALIPGAGGTLCYAACGHPPLLHYCAATGEVTRQGVENFPLGLFADAGFRSISVPIAPGDVVAIYTDGLEEIFDRQQREFGLDGLSQALRQSAHLPLADASAAIAAAARAFGPQTDDQTLLLIRAD